MSAPASSHLLAEHIASSFACAQIYTSLSPSLVVAVNPFRPVADTGVLTQLALHALANVQRQPQTILVAGDSGTGKTESIKIMLEACLLRSSAGLLANSSASTKNLVSPLLESFGNAATSANRNSSRFAKLVSLHVSDAGQIRNAQISTHLFERSRVTARPASDRNFHVFYHLLAGLQRRERLAFASQLGIAGKTAADFRLLRTDNCVVSAAEDALGAERTMRALAEISVDTFARRRLYRVLAACLHLGEVSFEPDAHDAAQLSANSASVHAQLAANLLGVPLATLRSVLCLRKVSAGGSSGTSETIVACSSVEQAARARDSLIKELYSSVFAWVVEASNLALKTESVPGNLHLLDIMGFEVLLPTPNGFEQFLINFANEHLQGLFIARLVADTQDLYQRELASAWPRVEVADNGPVIDTLGRMFALLDEEVVLPKGSSASFAARSIKACRSIVSAVRFEPAMFRIEHFVGPVVYDSSLFLAKSVERVDAELAAFVRGTKCPQLAAAPAAAARPSHQRSVGAAFKCELAGLLSTISHTSLSFVRCIRPNGVQSPSEFDLELVTQQLACSGVEAALRVARLTYPRRATLEQFRADFACVAKLVPALPSQDLAVGKTLVFMSEKGWGVLRQAVRLLQQQAARRMQAAARRMMAKAEAQRLAQLQTWACVALQRAWRMATAKKSLANARRAAITVQAFARQGLALRVAAGLRREREHEAAAVRVQAGWRGFASRRAFADSQAVLRRAPCDAELVAQLRLELVDRDRRVLELEIEVARLREAGARTSPPEQLKKRLGELQLQMASDSRAALPAPAQVLRERQVSAGVLQLVKGPNPFAHKKRVEAIREWTLDAITENDASALEGIVPAVGTSNPPAPCPRLECFECRGQLLRLKVQHQALLDGRENMKPKQPAVRLRTELVGGIW